MSDTASVVLPIKPVENRKPDGTFGPGNNANPNGRPKGKTFSGYLREALEKIDPKTGKETYVSVAEALLRVALRGDVAAIKEFADRLDGKPSQKTDITSNGQTITGNTIVFKDFSDGASR